MWPMPHFDDFDFSSFWMSHPYALKNYTDAPCTPEVVAAVEDALGYTLPSAYVALATRHNGGMPSRTAHRTPSRTSWAADHVAVSGIFSIGQHKDCSLSGRTGSRFFIDDWGYPPIGVYFADCPSAGHDMLCLDYRACGPHGEPAVVHVDQECGYAITPVAPDFESFIRGLQSHRDFAA